MDVKIKTVADELRKYRLKLSDAEWEGQSLETISYLRKEVQYYERLQKKGILYEPTF
jgi:hypothetical protein